MGGWKRVNKIAILPVVLFIILYTKFSCKLIKVVARSVEARELHVILYIKVTDLLFYFSSFFFFIKNMNFPLLLKNPFFQHQFNLQLHLINLALLSHLYICLLRKLRKKLDSVVSQHSVSCSITKVSAFTKPFIEVRA